MRQYQVDIYSAVLNKKNWGGSNVVVNTTNNITSVLYYGNKIAEVNHNTKTARLDNCGHYNASTTARINAVKEFCNDYNYKY